MLTPAIVSSLGGSCGVGLVGGLSQADKAAFLLPPPTTSKRRPTTSLHPQPRLLLMLERGGTMRQSMVVCNKSNRRLSTTKIAVALDSDQLSSSSQPSPKEQGKKKYYFVVANAKFMLDEEEHFKELLSERLRLYGERDKQQDFWLVIEPKFLHNFPIITNRLRRPAVALVSTNAAWITFMKLRLDRVLSESYEADSLEEALASNPTDLEFDKPANWVAPYPKYEFGWWEPFLPAAAGI